MACTTILVGKKASYDGSTMIARNDDGMFDEKKLVMVDKKKQGNTYKSKIAHLTVKLPKNPLKYTATPSVSNKEGIWAANGINELNVAMTATETITSNPRVMGADPYVVYEKGKTKCGGIGEEDLVVLILPYIKSAREGVIRLGELLEKYGTYEPNGIAFSDENEIWWAETIGGHHFIARRVKDDEYVIMPNQLGIDRFDFKDAFGEQKENICSKDMKEFIAKAHLDLNLDGSFNPRLAFGSHDDSDHVYNTPRAWFMGRYFNPTTYKWDGENADFKPESDNIPWALKPEHKITVDEVKYILSSYYQGTPYNPFAHADNPLKAIYRPIGISRTGVMAILQIRPYVENALKPIEWICFGPNPFNAVVPVYTNVSKIPAYFANTTMNVDSNNFYWASRLIAALADPHFGTVIQEIERYQEKMANKSYQLVNKYDEVYSKKPKMATLEKANEEIAKEAKKITTEALGKVLRVASMNMKCGYNRKDN